LERSTSVSARPGVEIIRDRKEKETEGGDRKTTIPQI
jgi:hypothetical protein